MIILEENFRWHLEACASELFIYCIYQRCSGLLRCDSIGIYDIKKTSISNNVLLNFYLSDNPEEMDHIFHQNIKQHNCFQHEN